MERTTPGAAPVPADRPSADAAARPGRGLRARMTPVAVSAAVAAVLAALILLPLVFVVLGAVSEDVYQTIGGGFTTRALADAYASPDMLLVLAQTLLMAGTCGVAATVLGGALAWTLTRVRLPMRRALELMVISPLFLSPFVGAMAWVALAAPRSGMLNQLASQLGLPGWVHLDVLTFGGMIGVLTLYYVPYGYLFTAGTLQNMDPSLEEASYVNGRGVLATALRVTLPLVRASLMSSVLFISILASGMFSVPAILGVRSSFVPLAVHVYRATRDFPADYALAAAIGTMLVLVSAAALALYQRSIRHSARFVTVSGKARAVPQVAPGPLAYPLVAAFLLYGAVAVALPYAALVVSALTPYAMRDLTTLRFTLDNVREVLASPALRAAFTNTSVVAVVTAAGCVGLGLLTVYVTERIRPKGAALVGTVAMTPLAVPGIVFGTGMLWLYLRTPLHGTLAVLVIAYVATYLPHAIRITGNGLLQIDPALEEASVVCGASRARTVGRIVTPLLKPSVFSASVLVLIFTVREINTAIMLYTPRTTLASVLAYNFTEQGAIPAAAVVGLAQTLLMIVVVLGARWLLGVTTERSQL